MNLQEINCCPGTLAEGYSSYSPKCLRAMFDGKKVSHILTYDAPQKDEEVTELFLQNRKRISISGVQEKLSLILDGRELRLTKEGEQGTYILKPIPRDLKKVTEVPANEHLTMQIAAQVYYIPTAAAAMIFFKDGTPAYITRRFDVKADGTKRGKEDFATLAGKTKDSAGPDFKYEYNYEDAGRLIQQFVPAWRVEIERYFVLVLFNYLFANGDSHLKNFSLLESDDGDYRLAPAYDLVNTRLHVDDTDFALSGALFADDYRSDKWKKRGHASKDDFMELSKRLGILEKRAERIMQPFLERQEIVDQLIERSFLNAESKRGYLHTYQTRRNYLNG